jgi:hypothetical protein
VVDGLHVAFRARQVVVVVANPLRHSNREWKVGAGGGRESPPSLESRAGGSWLAGKASHTRFERGRVGANPLRHSNCEWEGGGWKVKPPTRISSEGGWARIRHSNREWEGGGSQVKPPTRISSEGGGAGGCGERG